MQDDISIYVPSAVGGLPPPRSGFAWLARVRMAVAVLAAQLDCQRLWIMFLAYAAVWWLFNALRPRLHSVCQSC